MAKAKTTFVCQGCGARSAKWVGRCATCEEWETVVEEVGVAPESRAAFGALGASEPQRLTEVTGGGCARFTSGVGELDRVLGGGVVPGSLVLVGGDPGIGKSTLLLQASSQLARSGRKVLYVTGEESCQQTRLRFDRIARNACGASSIGCNTPDDGIDLWLLAETSLERIDRHLRDLQPDVLVIDSIQTLHTELVSSAPGSVAQVREVTARLMMVAKGRGIATFLVGHVTKAGAIAGPRVLEHMVDTVLYFEGDGGSAFRILRAVKNRFGSTNEIGAFEMRGSGLEEVSNPSAMLLAERATGTAGSVVAASFEGTRPILVEVQALVSPTSFGNPRRTALGVDGGRVALLLAVLERKAGLSVGAADVFVNAVGGMRLVEPAVDLALVAALASSHCDRCVDASTVLFGEVGLGGEVRGVSSAEARIREAAQLGFRRAVIPKQNRLPSFNELEQIAIGSVGELLDRLF